MSEHRSTTFQNGSAVFHSEATNLWDLRQATKEAHLNGAETTDFVITYEELYYGNGIDQLLNDPAQLYEATKDQFVNMTGDLDGAVRCILLWEKPDAGVLLHLDGTTLRYAYYPPITLLQAYAEHRVAMELSIIAANVEGMVIHLDQTIPRGEHSLSELLAYLSEQLEI